MTSIVNAYNKSLHQPSASLRSSMVLDAIRREIDKAYHAAMREGAAETMQILAEIGEDIVRTQGSVPGMTTINGQDGVTIATQFKITDPNPDDAGIDAIEAARDKPLGD